MNLFPGLDRLASEDNGVLPIGEPEILLHGNDLIQTL